MPTEYDRKMTNYIALLTILSLWGTRWLTGPNRPKPLLVAAILPVLIFLGLRYLNVIAPWQVVTIGQAIGSVPLDQPSPGF